MTLIDLSRPWSVLVGDCAVTLAGLPVESVDAVVTDTPYGLSTLLDPPNLSREALWEKLTTGAKEAPIRTLLRAWLDTGDNPTMRGRGFMGKEWDALVPSPNTWRAVWRVMKPGAYLFAFGGTRTADLISLSLRLADFEVDDNVAWLYGQGMPKRVRLALKIDEHHEPTETRRARHARAKAERHHIPPAEHPDRDPFVGHDRALRPGFEPIVVAVKPRRGTVAENALRHGTGGLHVDACRLPRPDAGEITGGIRNGSNRRAFGELLTDNEDVPVVPFIDPRGGYPANVAMDEGVAAQLDEMSGELSSRDGASKGDVSYGYCGGHAGFQIAARDRRVVVRRDGGGASRFFYVAKVSSSERDAGLEDLPPLTAGERCDREDGSAGVNGYAGTRGEGGHNPHPTVKPTSLMRWLVRLASPPGANDPDPSHRPLVLDPFAGSGSTGVAAMREGVRFVGCELSEEYAEVMRRRLQHAYLLPDDEPDGDPGGSAPGQRSLF